MGWGSSWGELMSTMKKLQGVKIETAKRLRPWDEGSVDFTGWEYHNRRRDTFGRFGGEQRGARRGNSAQLHLRWKPQQVEFVKAKAIANQMEISTYLWHVIQGYYMLLDEAGDKVHQLEENRIVKGKHLPW